MPRKAKFDFSELERGLIRFLGTGLHSSQEICGRMGISQATFSRLAAAVSFDLVVIGKGKNTRYGITRNIDQVPSRVPIYKVDENGKTARFADLIAIPDKKFICDYHAQEMRTAVFDDLPYFLDDLRPAGFLGRLVPKLHPKLNLPDDIRRWSADHCLKYLTRFGSDLIGNFIIGEEAFRRYLERAVRPAENIPLKDRAQAYPRKAREIFELGDAGSSAGGEQPKFTAKVAETAVIVKFSPRIKDGIGRRRADLLLCENIALNILGSRAARARIIDSGDQIFLEVERFDRTAAGGRRGVISLRALDAEFIGSGRGWVTAAASLEKKRIISAGDLREVRSRGLFGRLIANSDMHSGNLSFYFEDGTVRGVAPVYDMLPMQYAPRNDEIIPVAFQPPLPGPDDADIWKDALDAALEFWKQVSEQPLISREFRKTAKENRASLQSLRRLGSLLPDNR